MATKKQLIAEAQEKGIALTGKETVKELNALLGLGDNAKPTPKASRSGVEEKAAFEGTVNKTKEAFNAQPKVTIFVPLEPGEPKNTQLPINVNGFQMYVPKGRSVVVPQTVAEIVAESLNVEFDNSASSLRADRNDETKTALNL